LLGISIGFGVSGFLGIGAGLGFTVGLTGEGAGFFSGTTGFMIG